MDATFLSLLQVVESAHERLGRNMKSTATLPRASVDDDVNAQAAITVIFGVTFAEAYVQNYAARRLGATFAAKHVERLDVVSKWVIVPTLATGVTIRNDHPAIATLLTVVRARNALVHLKTGGIAFDVGEVRAFGARTRQRQRGIIEAGLNVPYCVGQLARLLREADPKETLAAALVQSFGAAERFRLAVRKT
jgi:hypothetical protein